MYKIHESRQRTLAAPSADSCITNVSRPVTLRGCHPHHSSAALRTGQTARVAVAPVSADPMLLLPYHTSLTPLKAGIEQESPS